MQIQAYDDIEDFDSSPEGSPEGDQSPVIQPSRTSNFNPHPKPNVGPSSASNHVAETMISSFDDDDDLDCEDA